jgi:hypothetical protein
MSFSQLTFSLLTSCLPTQLLFSVLINLVNHALLETTHMRTLSSADKMPVDKMTAHKMPVDEMTANKMPVDKMAAYEMPVDE